jgi:hypothetical protein
LAEEETIGIIQECLTYNYRDATAERHTWILGETCEIIRMREYQPSQRKDIASELFAQ